MPGPPPNPQRVRRNADPYPTVKLTQSAKPRGPELPADALDAGEEWHPRVVEWWEAWRRSPQASQMTTDPDWQELLVAARIYQDFWTSRRGRATRAAEMRMRVSAFGATYADRLRLRWELDLEDPAPVGDPSIATVTDLDARRDRLGGG